MSLALTLLKQGIAIIFSFLTAFGAVGQAGEKSGGKAFDPALFTQTLNKELKKRTNGKWPGDTLKITLDPTVKEVFAQLKKNSEGSFDFENIAAQIPDFYQYMRKDYEKNPEKYNKKRDQLIAEANAYQKSGDKGREIYSRLLGISAAYPTEIYIYHKNEKFFIRTTYGDGSTLDVDTWIYYNPATGMIYHGTDGVASTGFEVDVKNGWAQSSMSPQLQRVLGYTWIYDAVFLNYKNMINVDTVRLKFDYKGKAWMIQLWKGRYFFMSGGEVGLYNKPKITLSSKYDCAAESERIPMSFKLTAKPTNKVIIDRPVTKHWWMTGFAMREKVYAGKDLLLETLLTPTDAEMRAGIIAALKGQAKNGVQYTEKGDALRIRW